MSIQSVATSRPLRWIFFLFSLVFLSGVGQAQTTPTQEGPTGTTNVNPTIRWTGSGEWFQIWVSAGTSAGPGASMISDQYGQGVWLEDPSPLELTLDGDVLTNGTALLPGNYVWYVRSWVAGVTSAWSSGMNFTVVAVDELAPLLSEIPEGVLPVPGMRWIKPGSFVRGSHPNEVGRSSNESQHKVTLTKGFYMSAHEVTQAEYVAVIGSNPSQFTGDLNRPVEQVSWDDAVAYCAALTTTERTAGRIPAGWEYRLPTEAEWEYCCRAGGGTTRFSYGDDVGATALEDYAWFGTNSGSTTHPVEQKLGNAWGLHDMHGNVWEWCQDRWDGGGYSSGSVTDPQGQATGSNRVLRGGSWSFVADYARCAFRVSFGPSFAGIDLGFRSVLAPVQ